MKRSFIIAVPVALALLLPLLSGPISGQAQTGKTEKPAAVQGAVAQIAPATSGLKQSVAWVLELDQREMAQMDRIYEKYASIRLAREAELGPLRDDLEKEGKETPLDESKLANLSRKIRNAESSIASAFVLAHASAIRQLGSDHLEHLRTLPTNSEAFRDDRFWQLLVMKAEDLWSNPIDDKAAGVMLQPQSFKSVSPVRYRYFSAPNATFRSYGYGSYGTMPFFRPGYAHVWVFGRYFGHYWQ